jgi:hypothetical protein
MNTSLSVNAISPKTIKRPYELPNSPKHISKDEIIRINNIEILKKKEKQYDEFLEKNWHVLLLLDQAEEVLEVRDFIVSRIIILEREEKELFQKMTNFISY